MYSLLIALFLALSSPSLSFSLSYSGLFFLFPLSPFLGALDHEAHRLGASADLEYAVLERGVRLSVDGHHFVPRLQRRVGALGRVLCVVDSGHFFDALHL